MEQNRILEILDRLKQNYPSAHCTLNYKTPFQLLIATILSAQCTDERVNKVTLDLFQNLPDPKSFKDASLTKIESLIVSTGFYHQKAKHIKAACEIIENDFRFIKGMKTTNRNSGFGISNSRKYVAKLLCWRNILTGSNR